ncbi:MAG: hypothetical protein AB7N73_06940 [Gemmatimonadales bacterium]
MRTWSWCGVIVLALAAGAVPPRLHAQQNPDKPLPQLQSLVLTADVDVDAGTLAGVTTLVLRNTGASEVRALPLLLNRLLRVDSVLDAEGNALPVQQAVVAFEDVDTWQVTAARVQLRVPIAAGDSTAVVVHYHGHLVGYTEVGMLYVRDRIDREFTILREDAFAFPKVGVPSVASMRANPQPPFAFSTAITVPEGLMAVTGGRQLPAETHDGRVTWRSESRGPAPYLIVSIAPYRVAQRGEIRVYHFPEDSVGAQIVLGAIGAAADRLAEIFGPLRAAPSLVVMEIPEGWGSQASLAGGIIQEAPAFRSRDQLQALYHELSHLWNARDLDAPSPRWNEGLASYLQGRLARELDGWTGERAALERVRTRLIESCTADTPCGTIPMRDYGRASLTDRSYLVARLMFWLLAESMGEERLDTALREHFQRVRETGTRTDDLRAALIRVGGEPARRILDDWLDGTGWVARLSAAPDLAALREGYRR